MLMAVMMAPRENWTDGRLDDLKEGMGTRFDQVDKQFEQVDKRFDQVDANFARVDTDIRELRGDIKDLRGEMNERFESLNRTLIIATVGGNAAIIAALIGVNVF
jgi:archaellum component FlaC